MPGANGETSIYDAQLLPRGFVKPEDQEPGIAGLDFYLDAFRDLGTCRPSGLDLQPIPFTAIVEYSRIYPIDDFDEFAGVVRMMDDCYLQMNREVMEKERGKNGNGTGNANATNPNRN